ncbi:MAG TPA: hypothetical protein VFV00_18680 [Acidimicrobiales bacterium]|nr:hypothetical protein [Acidimicrobiales bacterium]
MTTAYTFSGAASMWIDAEPVVPFFIRPSGGRSADSFVCDGGGAQREDDFVRHVNDADLDQLEPLLEQLRSVEGLRERKRGNFMYRSRSFLHFHAHGDEFFADVRLTDDFERFAATTASEQRTLVQNIRSAVRRLRA